MWKAWDILWAGHATRHPCFEEPKATVQGVWLQYLELAVSLEAARLGLVWELYFPKWFLFFQGKWTIFSWENRISLEKYASKLENCRWFFLWYEWILIDAAVLDFVRLGTVGLVTVSSHVDLLGHNLCRLCGLQVSKLLMVSVSDMVQNSFMRVYSLICCTNRYLEG